MPRIVAVLLMCVFSSFAVAEVADSSAGGFTVKLTTQIHASPSEVYSRVVHNVGDWWDGVHTFSGDAHNLSIEDRPQGCFCEKLAAGGVRHMEVVFASPGKMLRMSGGLGPLQGIATAASMTLAFTPTADGTRLDLTYSVAGYTAQGMANLAAPVNSVLMQQMTRLKNYVETGNPAGKAEAPK